MKVLVMGGTQFNGLALVHELVRTGHEVTVLNRGRSDAPIPASVHRLYADRTDHDTMREVLGGLEFDCVQDMSAYHPEDVELMIELFSGRTGHYVFASSTVTYAASEVLPIAEGFTDDRGAAQIEYGLHKLLCEDLLFSAHRERGFPATTVPFSMVFGPHNALPDREQRMFVRLLTGRPVLIPGTGTTLGQVGHVDDQARALRMMMGNPITFGKRYNLTGGEYYTDNGYVSTFERVVGATAERVHVPAEVMDGLWDGEIDVEFGSSSAVNMDIRSSQPPEDRARATGRRKFQISQLIQRLAPNIHRWDRPVCFSIERLKSDIGWVPEFTFESMVAHTYQWFRQEGLADRLEYDWTFEDQLLAHLANR